MSLQQKCIMILKFILLDQMINDIDFRYLRKILH